MNKLGDQLKKDLNGIKVSPDLIARTMDRIRNESDLPDAFPSKNSHNRVFFLRTVAVIAAVALAAFGAVYLFSRSMKSNQSAGDAFALKCDTDSEEIIRYTTVVCDTQDETLQEKSNPEPDTPGQTNLSIHPFSGNYDTLLEQMRKYNLDDNSLPTGSDGDCADDLFVLYGGSSAFSQTGNFAQRADVIQYDPSRIYVLEEGIIRILDVRDPSEIRFVSEITLPLEPNQSLIEFLFDSERNQITTISIFTDMTSGDASVKDQSERSSFVTERVMLDVYDIQDPDVPKRIRSFSQEGRYITSFSVEDRVFLITTKSTQGYSYENTSVIPSTREDFAEWSPIPIQNIYRTGMERIDFFTVLSSMNPDGSTGTVSTIAFTGLGNQIHYADGYLFFSGLFLSSPSETGTPDPLEIFMTRILSVSIQNGTMEGVTSGYAARVLSDRIYLIDGSNLTLSVVDAPDPAFPEITGSTRIPGFKCHWEPINDDHLLFIGQVFDHPDSEHAISENRSELIFSVFDVEDPKNPFEKSSLSYGDRFGSSSVISDSKMLLFDWERGLIGAPVQFNDSDSREDIISGYLILRVNNDGTLTQEYFIRSSPPGLHDDRGILLGDMLIIINNQSVRSFEMNTYRMVDELILPRK
ncbi:MAG: hypothetical protein GXY43_00700 [Clostridiaceae bacterium]|nr:hypothetical protein [Clostridiaceae bacterium]